MTITLSENFRAVFYAPFYVAHALEAYRDEGVDVRLKTSDSPGPTAGGLSDGEAGVWWGGPMRMLVAHDQRADSGLVAFCEVVTRDPFFVVGRVPRPDFHMSDLTGLRVGTVSEVPTPWMCLQDDFRRAGLDPAKLERVADKSMADNAAALRDGALDAIQVFDPSSNSSCARAPGTSGMPPRRVARPRIRPSTPSNECSSTCVTLSWR